MSEYNEENQNLNILDYVHLMAYNILFWKKKVLTIFKCLRCQKLLIYFRKQFVSQNINIVIITVVMIKYKCLFLGPYWRIVQKVKEELGVN